MSSSWLSKLGIDGGIVAAVGAGGKKTSLYNIAANFYGQAGITTTVFLAPFPASLDAHKIIAPPDSLADAVINAAQHHRVVAFAHESAKKARYGGLEPNELWNIQQKAKFDLLLVKADGARMRAIKAPSADEPVLPPRVDILLYLVSSRALGARLDEDIAHRVDRIEAVTGARRGEHLTAEHVGRLLSADDGALKGAGDSRVIPIINLYEGSENLAQAQRAARHALANASRFDEVILACMNRASPLIEIIRR